MQKQRTIESPLMLYGAPVGLYTGKIRCYLRKQGIPFIERLPSDPVFRKEILPQIGRFINPVIKMPDGRIVQDTADIIDFLEAEGYAREASTPATPHQRIAALILDLFGGEGLVRPAMHYRWSYRKENEAFLKSEFGSSYRTGRSTPDEIEKQLNGFMSYLNAYLPKFGITPQTKAVVEASYEDILSRLEPHFRRHPYALGGKPTVADYGLVANLYAHLARDPYPSYQMKMKAPCVYRWTERMNACDADTPEFPRYPYDLANDDSIPDTLFPVFEYIASDYLPELLMTVESSNQFLSSKSGTEVAGKLAERSIGTGTFILRGQAIDTMVAPYTLYKLQKITDVFDRLTQDQQLSVRDMLRNSHLEPILSLKAACRVERKNHLEIWGAASV